MLDLIKLYDGGGRNGNVKGSYRKCSLYYEWLVLRVIIMFLYLRMHVLYNYHSSPLYSSIPILLIHILHSHSTHTSHTF